MANSTMKFPVLFQDDLQQQLYSEYRNAGHSVLFMSTALLLNAVSLPGIAMNLFIIHVTLKYRNLRASSSSFLLALTALFECVHALGHLLFLYVALSGLNFIPFSICFKFLLIPFSCNVASLCSIALTGLDRFLQLAFTNMNFAHPLCLFAYFAISLMAGFVAGYKYFDISHQIPEEWPQTGFIGDLLPAEKGQFHLALMFGLNAMAILFYLAIWLLLRLKTNSASIHSHILKSMAVIIGINIGGSLLNAFVRLFIIPQMDLNQIQVWVIQTYLGILLNLCVALNAVVLYICSTEYRACFNKELHLIFHRNRVQTINLTAAKIVASTKITP